jgi:hypothetical protein
MIGNLVISREWYEASLDEKESNRLADSKPPPPAA